MNMSYSKAVFTILRCYTELVKECGRCNTMLCQGCCGCIAYLYDV